MVIIPKNYSLMSVNIFVALTGLYQVGRGIKYQMELSKQQKLQDAQAPETVLA